MNSCKPILANNRKLPPGQSATHTLHLLNKGVHALIIAPEVCENARQVLHPLHFTTALC